eukprot:TRINITY_DN106749_c0_g1_i1.p1 TRINITY_DN106749_c0_g1~~TRINITY_DN106749_c0_g1_i1.p1  ORF type:complete len:184 (+),score=29.36 TRINITY_DN106749_c0_g1_i1:32-583(+)
MGNNHTNCNAEKCRRLGDCAEDSEGEGADFGPNEAEVVEIPNRHSHSSSSSKDKAPVRPPKSEAADGALPCTGPAGAFALGKHGNSQLRPAPIRVSLMRQGAHWRTLGLLVSPDDDPQHLVVDDIWGPSLVTEWNAQVPEEQRIHIGDQIIAVNNVSGIGEEMLHAIQVQASAPGSRLDLLIR